ncbi:BBE domain-containing protein [Micromonospora sp. NPDC048842]|uniref:BBE domain-containing protein n=1 Tax=unclassified Micromonospora TaxID=2617518 RepID=UPI0033F0E2DC
MRGHHQRPVCGRTSATAARSAAAALDPYADGVYVNSLAADEGQRGVRRAYPAAKLARLTALKTIWDPHNVFHLNHNIRPHNQ